MARVFSSVPSGRNDLWTHFQPRCGWLISGCPCGTKQAEHDYGVQTAPRRGWRFGEDRGATKIPLLSALASGDGATAPKRPAATMRACRAVTK
jgi:hypothetical protein